MTEIAEKIFEMCPFDGKYILNEVEGNLIICQSNADSGELERFCADQAETVLVNPLGDWTGGTDVDSGATNRKLGSDMADSVTGGGLHGKELSKADVSVSDCRRALLTLPSNAHRIGELSAYPLTIPRNQLQYRRPDDNARKQKPRPV